MEHPASLALTNGSLMRCKSLRLYVLLGCLLPGHVPALNMSSKETEVAGILETQFTTVVVAGADLLGGKGPYRNLSASVSNALRLPFAELLAALDSMPGGGRNEVVKDAVAVVVGAREFRPPSGLGSDQSLNCYVLALNPHARVDLRRMLVGVAQAPTDGGFAWTWTAHPTEGHPAPHEFFAIQLAPSYILVTNNVRDAGAVARALAPHPGSSARSADGPWRGRSARDIVGVRRRGSGDGGAVSGVDALQLFVDTRHHEGVLRLVGKGLDARSAEALSLPVGIRPFGPGKGGALETTFELGTGEEGVERLVGVWALFGFGLSL